MFVDGGDDPKFRVAAPPPPVLVGFRITVALLVDLGWMPAPRSR